MKSKERAERKSEKEQAASERGRKLGFHLKEAAKKLGSPKRKEKRS
jgi:hypothetical protein